MKIAVDIRSLMEGRRTGVEEYTVRILEHMMRCAPHHSYHFFYNSARPVYLPSFEGNSTLYGFEYPNKILDASQALFGKPTWDRLLSFRPDAVFVPNPRLVPLSSDIPLVSVAHDVSFARFPEFLNWRRRAWHRITNPRKLMRASRCVIAVSEHTKRDVMHMYDIPEERMFVVHSGVSGHMRPPAERDVQNVRRRYGLPEKYILYFGALEPRKNIPSIVRAFSAIASNIPHDLVIAGERGWLERHIRLEVRRSAYANRIHMPGRIREEDKAALYGGAGLFVYPSFYEGFGFPPLEALCSGTPVVTSFNSALPEVVGRWARLIDPYHVAQLAAVMKETVDMPVPLSVRSEVQSTYSWDVAARKTIRIIEQAYENSY